MRRDFFKTLDISGTDLIFTPLQNKVWKQLNLHSSIWLKMHNDQNACSDEHLCSVGAASLAHCLHLLCVHHPHFTGELNSADTDLVFVFYLCWGAIYHLWPQNRCSGLKDNPHRASVPKLGLPWEPQLIQTAPCVVLILGHCHQQGGEHLFWKHNFAAVNSLLLSHLILRCTLIKVF